MTDAVLISLVTGAVTLGTQILTMIAAQRARAAADEAKKQSIANLTSIADNTQLTKEVHEKVDKVASDIDGKMSDLLKLTAESEKAKGLLEGNIQGNKEGIAQEKSEQRDRDNSKTTGASSDSEITGTIRGDVTIKPKK